MFTLIYVYQLVLERELSTFRVNNTHTHTKCMFGSIHVLNGGELPDSMYRVQVF